MNEFSKRISFCIPSYNSEEYLHYALDSLLGYDDIEVLVIDDGSRDGTLAVAQSYQDRYPDVFRAIHQENKGHGGAINTALGLCTGEYFKVLDSDDWVDHDAMDKLMAFLRQPHETMPDLILMDYVYQQGRDNPSTRIHFDFYFPKNEIIPLEKMKRHMRIRDNVTLHSAIYRTEMVRSCGVVLPEHCSYEDNYFVYAPLTVIDTVCYIPEPLYQYLIGRDGQSMNYETCVRKYKDFVRCGYLIFDYCDITKFKNTEKKRYRILRHHFLLSMMMAVIYPLINASPEAKKDLDAFNEHCEQTNPELYKLMRRDARVSAFNGKSKFRRGFARFMYALARKIVKFN